MISILYNTGILIYGLAIKMAALFNKSASLWVAGRKDNTNNLVSWRQTVDDELIWIHCASHGEYEQGLPLINLIKQHRPNSKVALTFFSPSGYNAVAKNNEADWIGYIPLDTLKAARLFVKHMKPTMAIFVKNEWWWNMLSELQRENVPAHYISSTIRKDHYFIKYSSPLFTKVLERVSTYGTVDKVSCEILSQNISTNNVYVSGDLRVDRVLQIASSAESIAQLESLKTNKILVYGSVWESDVVCINKLIKHYQDYHHIIYPHRLDKENVHKLQSIITNAEIYEKENIAVNNKVTIMPIMGQLSSAYKYASLAYVGGGHGVGIHNVLEAAVYKVPVFTGPNIAKSKEAAELKNLGLLHVINSSDSVNDIKVQPAEDHVKIADSYFNSHKGGAILTYNHIFGESLT